jgi:hypothetical protein
MRIYRLTTINVSLNFDTNAANDDYPRVFPLTANTRCLRCSGCR